MHAFNFFNKFLHFLVLIMMDWNCSECLYKFGLIPLIRDSLCLCRIHLWEIYIELIFNILYVCKLEKILIKEISLIEDTKEIISEIWETIILKGSITILIGKIECWKYLFLNSCVFILYRHNFQPLVGCKYHEE